MPEIKLYHSIAEIDADSWNSLCPDDYPFMRYEFLHALETSGSVNAHKGWQPVHISIQDNGINLAFMPLYLKNHSYGEYVFDWSWADAYQRYGLHYYPKLVSAIPYSPVPGTRLLTQQPVAPLLALIAKAIPAICQQLGAHSWHLLFPNTDEKEQLHQPHLMARKGCQYQWFNRGYSSFEHYLSHFNSRKRKSVKKERQKIIDQGIHHVAIEGPDITEQTLAQFYQFYQMTYFKRGQEPYLSAEFFQLLQAQMPENLLLVMAYSGDTAVAGALSLKDSTTLYGRYWGCIDEYDSLHFETCYYQGLDYCIAQGLQRFDSGAQGEHKIQRGFEPVETWSLHWLEEQGLNPAIADFIERETAAVDERMQDLASYLPFKQVE